MNHFIESYFFDQEIYFMQHTPLRKECATLLFIHGLGDSSINYRSFLSTPLLKNYNILIPDLLGYGKSSNSADYSFQHQVNGLLKHLAFLEQQSKITLNNIVLISHSMGGIHATLLCESPLKEKIIGFINVEGSITQYGAFISNDTVKAITQNNFPTWFHKFKEITVYAGGKNVASLKHYYASLQCCRPEAFAQNASEMQQLSHYLSGEYTHLMGQKYIELQIPRVYCHGTGLAKQTLTFLQKNHLTTHEFPTSSHFVMTECFNHFVKYVIEFTHTVALK